ncbi:hypothetical protein LTR36_006557 [Oleoguttula mirabilis]|uniref:Phosphatidic acid phosphatase type 2/haloperoxidase domain-containing protein n=1 Tax=Oleoguttula mirabilis TaxID=1507867 RepID=A0AAV9JWV5_9PEZI|nr:hypothetical protein LTR36_006557 [Oleoguttula mirabilis]
MAGADTARNGRSKAKPSPNNGDTGGLYAVLQRFWHRSYAGDYVGLVLLLAAYLVIQFLGEPFHRLFRLDDPRISFPHAEVEGVPVSLLFVYAAAVPLALLVLWALVFRPSIHKAHVTILGLAVSIILTSFITDVLKDAIGRPRPDLIARCKPSLSAPQHELVTVDVCTETDHHTLHDGWRSYPSGHSSFAFAGLGYLAMFLASQTHAIRPRASLAVVLLCLAPLLAAALIAVSRLQDYRHDVGDVVCGSLLGFGVALYNFRRYYPSLLSPTCCEPHALPSASGRTSPSGGAFQRVRDEEEGYGTTEPRFSSGDEGEGYGRDGPR